MAYKAAVRLGLPQVKLDDENKPVLLHGQPVHTGESTIFEVGADVSVADLKRHGQSDEQIQELVTHGSLVDAAEYEEEAIREPS